MGRGKPTRFQVLLYVPNLIGYVRLALIAAAVGWAGNDPQLFVWLFFLNFVLDGVDGTAARRLQQTSAFGAFLDVLIDNLSRGLLWVGAVGGYLSFVPPFLEMLTFCCTHKGGGAAWKTGVFKDAPFWIKAILANNFKNVLGCFAIGGLMGCPLWLWCCRYLPNTWYSSMWIGAGVIPGRLLAAMVEVWVVYRHLQGLLDE